MSPRIALPGMRLTTAIWRYANRINTMLKGISPVISPDLIKVLIEMGHGDELVIADGNFPSASIAQRLVRAEGLGCLALLDAILNIFPLDQYVEKPVVLMTVLPGDPYQPVIWEDYREGKNAECTKHNAN